MSLRAKRSNLCWRSPRPDGLAMTGNMLAMTSSKVIASEVKQSRDRRGLRPRDDGKMMLAMTGK